MKICPKCETRYTDVSLKFCLQDGSVLTAASEQKTEVFDTDAFAQKETVAVEASVTGSDAGYDQPQNGPDKGPAGQSEDTIERPRPRRAGGFGFFSGLVVGALVLGALVAIGLAVSFLPDYFANPGNSNAANTSDQPQDVTNEMIESVTASSSRRPYKGILYIPENAIDRDPLTAWCEGGAGTGKGEWIKITFTKALELDELTIKPGYFKNASIWKKNNRVASVRLQFSNGQNRIFDFPDEMRTQKLNLRGVETSFVKISLNDVYMGTTDIGDTLISEISFTAIK